MKHLCIVILMFPFSWSIAQQLYTDQLNNLSKAKTMPYIPELSGDDLFWEAVMGKLEILPYLIELISNDKRTKAHVPNFGGYYSVGDVAYDVITEIVRDVPTLDLIMGWEKFDESAAYGNYWRYVRESKANRIEFQEKIKLWFEANKNNLVWVEDKNLYLKEDREGAQRYPHPSGGYYALKK